MVRISKAEIIKLAHISQVNIYEDEIAPLIKQMNDLLEYAQRVKEVASEIEEEASNKNSNVFREDIIVSVDPEPIRAQAPQREADYFVVPAILEHK